MPNKLRNIKVKRDLITKNRYYKNIEYPEIPISENDVYIISKITDRLDLLAKDYYNDVKLWWVIEIKLSHTEPSAISPSDNIT